MILLLAIVAGLGAGLVRAWCGGHRPHLPDLRLEWLVPIAFLPQLLAFHLPVTREFIGDHLAAVALVSSQALLLAFAWSNRKQPGFWALGIGLALNLTVIGFNGGLMPVSPETLTKIFPDRPPEVWQGGMRLGWNVVLPVADMRLRWLSDYILLPAWFPIRKALSVGDVLIASGAFWFLWTLGGGERRTTKRKTLWSLR